MPKSTDMHRAAAEFDAVLRQRRVGAVRFRGAPLRRIVHSGRQLYLCASCQPPPTEHD